MKELRANSPGLGNCESTSGPSENIGFSLFGYGSGSCHDGSF